MRNRTILAALALALSQSPMPQAREPAASASAPAAWPQWGGPHRNFMSDSTGLAPKWPASGPKKLWSRPLGEGHSAIVAEGARLYTMYRPLGVLAMVRRSQEEVIAALDANTGTTIWEYKYPSPTTGLDFSQGAGPHATPLIADDQIFATGSRKELFALNKANGQVVWSHDMMKEYGATAPGRGYTCSPLLYNGTIIVTVGGSGQALAAFNQKTGALAWKAGDLDMSPASPILIDVDGQKQLLYFGGDRVAGFDPANGRMLWNHPHKTDWGLNISTPIWSPADHLLFVSSAYGTGSRVIELRQANGKTTPAEKWFSGKMRVHFGTAIRVGNYVYGSSGDFGPAFITAIDVNSGKIAWQDRAFSRAQLLYADGKLVILDEDGNLGLATVTPQGLQVLAKASVLENVAWTPPTLVGTRLYVRDRKNIAAFEVGGQ
jgi:outer membrane protein assembly factor BamB